MKSVIIAGGHGFLGKALSTHFVQKGYRVTILSRRPHADRQGVETIVWDGETAGSWQDCLCGADAVINLAGRTVNCRYTETHKREIYESRLRPTKALGDAIARCSAPPTVWLNASSATIYRHAEDRPMDEFTGEIGNGFSVDVCQRWEAMLEAASTPQTRKVALRTAMVFGTGEDGVYAAFDRIVRFGLGGTLGNGDQFVSWLHILDFVRAIDWVIEHDSLAGPVNISSPNPLPNREFMRIFRQINHQRLGLPATAWMLEIGAFFLQTETELLLKSRRVLPTRLLQSGFTFDFPEWESALSDIRFSQQ